MHHGKFLAVWLKLFDVNESDKWERESALMSQNKLNNREYLSDHFNGQQMICDHLKNPFMFYLPGGSWNVMFQCSKIVVFLFLSFFFSNFEIPFLSVLSSSLCDKTQKHDTCHGGGGNTTTPAETSLDWRQKYSLLRLCGFHTAASLHHSNFQWHSPGKKELIKVITKQRSR